jgi:hypothetical protein
MMPTIEEMLDQTSRGCSSLDGPHARRTLPIVPLRSWLATGSRAAHSLSITILGRPSVDLGRQFSTLDVPDALWQPPGIS